MMHDSKSVLVHLSLINGVGPAAVITLLKSLTAQLLSHREYIDMHDIVRHYHELLLSQVYQLSSDDFKSMGLSEKISRLLVDGLKNQKVCDDEYALAARHGIRLITLCDREYPDQLRHIAQPPIVLYIKGVMSVSQRMFAIVGSRKATSYAQSFIESTVPLLVRQGWGIVSGGALGVDTMAHRCTLYGGATVAVLGSGLLSLYPRDNLRLFEQIVEKGGALVSPFHLTAQPERWNFPARNRIIAGLSEGCLVVQAAEKSGALITAHHALENGRQVFAVPGLVSDPLSAGCHSLIKQGATLVQSAQDIADAFGMKTQEEIVAADVVLLEEKQRSIAQASDDPVLKHMQKSVSVDELCEQTGLELRYLQNRLFELQLEGKVEQDFTGMWLRI